MLFKTPWPDGLTAALGTGTAHGLAERSVAAASGLTRPAGATPRG
jgi:hypothetical protein